MTDTLMVIYATRLCSYSGGCCVMFHYDEKGYLCSFLVMTRNVEILESCSTRDKGRR
jgi:hypothetical protein